MRKALLLLAAVEIAAIGSYAVALRPRQLRWGAGPGETHDTLPGDDLIPAADLVATRAVTIRAPMEQVWPWLAQLGQGRGGFYSYDMLENLAGCEVRSAERIVPQWQDVAAGDDFRLHPEIALRVAQVLPQRALVVAGIPGPDAAAASPPYDFTWAFVLAPAGPGETRLLVRERYRYRTRWACIAVEAVSLVSFMMTRRMLQGIRERAECSPDEAG